MYYVSLAPMDQKLITKLLFLRYALSTFILAEESVVKSMTVFIFMAPPP